MKEKKKVRFIRRRGRIIPIRSGGKHKRAARDIFSKKNAPAIGTIAAATGVGFGGLFAAGRIERSSQRFATAGLLGKSSALNRMAKIVKFKSKAIPALIAGSALLSIDRRSKDEGTVFDIGNKTGALNIAITLGGAYAAARFGKRFEKFGLRGGKFPIKLKDI